MMVFAAATGLGIGVAATTYGFGFRHGIDWDHLAALTDLTSSQSSVRRSMRLATLYALGHSLVVFGLGVVAIMFAAELPDSVDEVMGRVVGLTLVALGVYVFFGLVRHGRAFRLRSRWMMVFGGVARLRHRIRPRATDVAVIEHDHPHSHDTIGDHGHTHTAGDAHPDSHDPDAHAYQPVTVAHGHTHRHLGSMPDDPFGSYTSRTAFGIGMLHGIGAETPTQVVLFVTAAGVAGRGAGIALLVCFIAGLLTSNTVVAAAGTAGVLSASRSWPLYATLSVLIGSASLVIGSLFFFGYESVFPTIFG
jgi:high-affinity nickel-transport protein